MERPDGVDGACSPSHFYPASSVMTRCRVSCIWDCEEVIRGLCCVSMDDSVYVKRLSHMCVKILN